MMLRLILMALMIVCYFSVVAMSSVHASGHWSHWSTCSTTCGEGLRWREKKCILSDKNCDGIQKQKKHCFLQFCPSYLSWPRIHFSGKMAADVNTVNNIRCAYQNDEFSAAELSKHFIGLAKEADTHTYYKFVTGNWNPDGSNQIYFVDTYVTSFCSGANKCSTTDSIVGLKVIESTRGVMAVLDPDWQLATEIWGLKVRIPGVLEGAFGVASHQVEGTRVDHVVDKTVGYSISAMSRYKSKLYNVTWYDDYYKETFSNSQELSITFSYDLFNQVTLMGRISGTIGLTSSDDARQVMATRVLQLQGTSLVKGRCTAPFYIHYPQRTMTLDLSNSVGGRQNGSLLASDLGKLDLALLLTKREYCRHFRRRAFCGLKGNENSLTLKWITEGGEITKRIGSDNAWFMKYGGVMDFELTHLDAKTWKLLKYTRVAILDSNKSVYMEEYPEGMAIGLTGETIFRLNPGQSKTVYGFASSFGRPVKNARFNLYVMKNVLANTICGHQNCNRTLGVPEEALGLSTDGHTSLTNESGLVQLVLEAKEDPGNPRRCGLDGQIYPLQLFVRYIRGGKSFTFTDNGLTSQGSGRSAEYAANTLSIAVQIYNSIPEKECPTWTDVKEIFVQYYNLYPIMWKSGIIDLHSYDEIRRRSKLLKAALFDTEMADPRYMPISRDLSKGKSNLIYNWMKCGMKRGESNINPKPQSDVCSAQYVRDGVKEIRRLLHKAVMLELSTIPPYVNAWLSLKTEFGRNKDIADILKSIFNEEMLHMSLAGNVLNAVGGVVNMTDESELPVYPTILATGDAYEICPDMQVGLAPFSIGLVEDVFSKIEKPSRFRSKQFIYHLAHIWKMLPSRSDIDMVSANMKTLVQEYEATNSTERSNLTAVIRANSTGRESVSSVITSNLKSWRKLADFANSKLNLILDFNRKTVGEFYSLIALKLTALESCLQIRNLESFLKEKNESVVLQKSIFANSAGHQLNITHWFQQSEDSIESVVQSMGGKTDDLLFTQVKKEDNISLVRPPLFEVTDLRTALEAIVEIVYQGEGGSGCSPYTTEPMVYASERGRERGHELSHYYRFQEIVNGRKLIEVAKPLGWTEWKCLNASRSDICSSLSNSGKLYCYAGDTISFYEDGVWPILFNPKEEHYATHSKAKRLHEQFNLLYTRLLFCLEETFGGKPGNMKNCMSTMYDLTIVGKKLVRTPLHVTDDHETIEFGKTGKNGAPTWLFARELFYRAGLPLRT